MNEDCEIQVANVYHITITFIYTAHILIEIPTLSLLHNIISSVKDTKLFLSMNSVDISSTDEPQKRETTVCVFVHMQNLFIHKCIDVAYATHNHSKCTRFEVSAWKLIKNETLA